MNNHSNFGRLMADPKTGFDLEAIEPKSGVGGKPAGGGGGGAGGGGKPPQQQNPNNEPKDLASSYVMAQINQCFKNDRIFHGIVSSKAEFRNLLGLIGKVPFAARGPIARNLGSVIDINARLLQDTKVFECINTILRNLPTADRAFQDLCGKIMLKIREALIKNRTALDLSNPIMMEYSEVIRKFLAMISPKGKSDFFNSLDEQILNFILGKITKDDKQKQQQTQSTQKQYFANDEDDTPEGTQTRMQKLVKMLFSDVMRLEPELISAVIMSLITQLPHGNMVIEDKNLMNNWIKSLN